MAKAPTADEMLPQLPLYDTPSWSMPTRGRGTDYCDFGGVGFGPPHTVDLMSVRTAHHALQDGISLDTWGRYIFLMEEEGF